MKTTGFYKVTGLAVLGSIAYSTQLKKCYAESKIPVSKLQENLSSLTKPWDKNWDGLEDQPHGKGTRNLFFIRHGQYHYRNQDSECKLTALGHEQASMTGERLQYLDFPYDKITFSTMTRAIQTKNEIIKFLPSVPTESTDSLREGACFPPEPAAHNWPSNPKDFLVDGERIENAFREIFHRAKPGQDKDTHEIYVCHANVIRYFVCRSLQLPPEAWLRFTLEHGSITWLTIKPSGIVFVRSLGNTGYMPKTHITVQ